MAASARELAIGPGRHSFRHAGGSRGSSQTRRTQAHLAHPLSESVTGDYRFDNPQVMELGLFPAACSRAAASRDGQEAALDPGRQISAPRACAAHGTPSPTMIHVAAQQLKATREPLSKYLRSYKSRPKVGDLPAYKAVREQLQHRGANAALNLISILAFFDQHVPVEMVMLGTWPQERAPCPSRQWQES